MYKKKCSKKKVFCRPVAIDWGRRTSALPNLSNGGWRTWHQTEPWLLGLIQRCLPFYFYFIFRGLLAFVRFSLSSLICSSARPLTVYSFYSGVQKQISKTKEWNHVGKLKKKIKRFKKKGQMLPFLRKSATLHRMKILLCYFQNSGIEQCCLVMFNLLYSVLMLFMDYLKPVCFMLIIYIFFLYIKKTEKKTKKDIIAHYLAHTRKSGSCLRKARVPEYQLHAILMYIFMSLKKKTKQKKNKGWLKRNNSKHWKLWISEEERIPFVSKSVAVT